MNNMKKTFIKTDATSVVATSVYPMTQYTQLSTSCNDQDSLLGIQDLVLGITA